MIIRILIKPARRIVSLPKIDQLIDATTCHQLLSFIDVFSGYNQIQMDLEDGEKIAFIIEKGLYYYKVMPFELKNAGATFQRLINKVFERQLGRNMDAYVDNMIVKSLFKDDHIKDLEESFDVLRRYWMKLNPTKCIFGVSSGKFLGFLVTKRGIEANLKKIQAIRSMRYPSCKKEVQQLTGRIASLRRFIF